MLDAYKAERAPFAGSYGIIIFAYSWSKNFIRATSICVPNSVVLPNTIAFASFFL